ncbi:MAG: endonuclease domain-containing protein [Oscillospiraceae bacterium]|nr:endonuclease domain-containing protein [Oscillospiraceae bacterium]
MNKNYNKKLQPNARTLRTHMTPEERHLWYDFLKKLPVTVKRQQVIGEYIVDFYCASAKLIIEVDGTQHYDDEGVKKDAVRDSNLSNSGYTIKRYSNRDIHRNFVGVCRDIYITIFNHDWD